MGVMQSLEDRQQEMRDRLGRQRKVKKRPSLSERQRKMRDRFFNATIEGRFKAKVDKHGPVHPRLGTRCWIWAGKASGTAGVMQVDGKSKLATHVLWFIRHGYWPSKGKQANHHCDHPWCINPKHLYLGSQKSNMRDMYQRGRHPFTSNGNESQRQARARKGGQACLHIYGRSFFQEIARKRHADARDDAQFLMNF